MGKLDGKVALITGGARGLGAEDARVLAAEGAKIVVCDLLDEEGQALAAEVGGMYQHLDVTSEEQWQGAIAFAEEKFGPVDILVNNAGVVGFTPLDTCDLAEWNRVININLTGTFLGIRYVADSMKRAGGGVIVNMSSTAGLTGYSQLGAYVASKWGVRGLTKSAALDLAPYKIRVVSVHPGPIETPMTAGLDVGFSRRPIPRIGQPAEVAAMVLFLVADATFSTGTEFVLDGGATIGEMMRT
ncbi:MAG: SDR family oxidoreductase [Candidatus Nanopelagicales bacterium]|nr:SDR family oxidoreductase [Candidatus Nanopelagicales bacterium]